MAGTMAFLAGRYHPVISLVAEQALQGLVIGNCGLHDIGDHLVTYSTVF